MKHNTRYKIRGFLYAILSAVFFGFSGTCGEFIFDTFDVDSGWITSIRMNIASLILFVIILMTQKSKAKEFFSCKKDVLVLVVYAIFGLYLVQYTYLTAIKYTNAGTATVLQYLCPALVMLYVCIRNSKLPKPIEILGIIFALIGIFLVATHGNIHNLVISKYGFVYGILAAITLMLSTILPIKLVRKWGSVLVVGYGMVIGGVVSTVIVRPWNFVVAFDIRMVIAIVLIALIGTVIPFLLYLNSITYIGPVKASMVATIEPISATLFSAVFLGTKFEKLDIVGFYFIISTVLLLSYSKITN